MSLLLNGFVLVNLFEAPIPGSAKMTCEQARNESLNKQATLAFAKEHNGSLEQTHLFLTASDYSLRNLSTASGNLTFVYTAESYPKTCGWYLPSIDGSIVRVRTDGANIPNVVDVN